MNKLVLYSFFTLFPSFMYCMDYNQPMTRLQKYLIVVNCYLFQQVDMNNRDGVEDALKRGASINVQCPLGTPLMRAALAGNKAMVEFLLSQEATIDAINSRGQTALMYASFSGHKDIVDLLIKRGANIHIRDIQGKTALLCTISKEIAQLLIDAGAPIDTADKQGWTLLMLAEYNGYTELKNFLIEKAASFLAHRNQGDIISPVYSSEDSSFDIFSLLNDQELK